MITPSLSMNKFGLFFLSFLFIISSTAFGQVIYTVVGNGKVGDSGEGGPAIDAEIGGPWAVTLDKVGDLYLCDGNKVKKISPAYNGTITTVAGSGYYGYTGDSCLATNAGMAGPFDLTFDSKGNMYIADAINNRIRKVNINDSITTIAGTGIGGYNGDSIPAISAQLNMPSGIAVDSLGNIYIADRGNYRIRKIDTNGIITTIAGTGKKGFSPDSSQADTSSLEAPVNIRISKNSELYFSDSSIRIRKISVNNLITTIAGSGESGYSGDNGAATVAEISVEAIDLDSSDNLFIADTYANRIRKVDKTGIITTIAGGGASGDLGDGGNPLDARLAGPEGVVVNNLGDVYICDNGHNRVRLITSHLIANVINIANKGVDIFPNPCVSNSRFTLRYNAALTEPINVNIWDAYGEKVYNNEMTINKKLVITATWPKGIYFIKISSKDTTHMAKLVVE